MIMLHENLNAVHHPNISLIQKNHLRILKNLHNGFFKQIQVYLLFQSDGWLTDVTYEMKYRAVVQQQYFP